MSYYFELYQEQLKQRLDPTVTIMQGINGYIKKNQKRIVFADGEDENTLKAAIAFKNSKLGIPILVCKEEKIKEHGIKFVFAGTQKDDPTKLHTIMQFPNMEALQAFKDDKELAEKRSEAGAVVESAVMIPISDEHLTNYPDAYTNH